MTNTHNNPKIDISVFGSVNGEDIKCFHLSNSSGMRADILNYGGIILGLTAPNRDGGFDDVILGLDSIETYQEPQPYFGAFVGRYANRIAYGKFTIDGKDYEVPVNLPPHHLHGGFQGFDRKLYQAETGSDDLGIWLKLRRKSRHLEEGFPGNMEVSVTYSLTEKNELIIDYRAVTDQATIINLTNHAYFNLRGAGNGDILNHELKINARTVLDTDENLIPTGRYLEIKDTPADFLDFHKIGERIEIDHPVMKYQGGYDHCFVLEKDDENDLTLAAEARDTVSGKSMKVYTTEPAVQLYSANFGETTYNGKEGKEYGARSGFCLETQHFPDSPNHPEFPSTLLRPGEEFSSRTIYAFDIID